MPKPGTLCNGHAKALINSVTTQSPNYCEVPFLSCKHLITEHHYSGRVPSVVKLCYGDLQTRPREVRAAVIFSLATGRWADNAESQGNIWELTRLIRLPEYTHPLTKLISKSIGYIRKNKLTELIVSFANVEEDHHGGIYQACSWLYDGIRKERLDGMHIDGVFVPARTLNAKYGTSSPTKLRSSIGNGTTIEEHIDQGKHCYWKALTKAGMKLAIEIGLKSIPYPKPMLSLSSQPTVEERIKALSAGHERRGMVELGDD